MDKNTLHRKAIESKYDAICSIYEYVKVKDEVTKLTKSEEILVVEGIPCHISFASAPATSDSGMTVTKTQTVKLFLAPEVVIKAGSKIVVTQNGAERAYRNSGESAIYPSHQEIVLELFERWT